MSAKAIREYYGKQLIAKWLPEYSGGKHTIEKKQVLITPDVLEPSKGSSFETIAQDNPWLLTDKLVVKPDQLIKRRGKAGLLAVNKSWEEVQAWIMERMQREVQVEHVKGVLNHFIVEAFVPHKQEEEYYFCIVVSTYCERGSGSILLMGWGMVVGSCFGLGGSSGWMEGLVQSIVGLRLDPNPPHHPNPTPTVQPRGRGDPLHARGRRGRR